jgi:hypothetical protein
MAPKLLKSFLVGCLGLLAGFAPVGGQNQDSSALTELLVLPFRNLTPEAGAKNSLMPCVLRELGAAGFQVPNEDSVASFLRRNRVRDTGQITSEQAQQLNRESDLAWILLGSIDVYNTKGTPETGLSMRVLNSLTGAVIWADSRYSSGADYAGLLGLGEITSAEKLAALQIHDLVTSLRGWWSAHPDEIRIPENTQSPKTIMLIIPFSNETSLETAGQVADNILLTLLLQRGYAVIEPGVVNEQLSSLGAASQGGIDLATLKILQARYNADYCITGIVDLYQEVSQSESGETPVVQVSVRMLQADTGKMIWARQVEHSGTDYTKVFKLGAVHDAARLLKISLTELVDTLPPKTFPPPGQAKNIK